MTTLRGPADADHFRVKVGRYHDRWYHDPLPGDDIAPATDDSWPSVSTIKKASGSDWSFVALKRINEALERDPNCLKGPMDERADKLRSINKIGLSRAAQRGTNIHGWAEQLLRGQQPTVMPGDAGEHYLPALLEWFDQYQPELFAAETPAIHRALGYGGTFDTAVTIKLLGGIFELDWKSRSEDSDHGAYPEEGAQIAAYARAEYWIIEGDNGPKRIRPPELDGGLIVSIKPEGCRTYPVDLDGAFRHWESMVAWWGARQTERTFVLKPLAPRGAGRKNDGREPVAETGLERVVASSSPVGGPTPEPAEANSVAASAVVRRRATARACPPDELGEADDDAICRLGAWLSQVDQAPIKRWIREAHDAGCDFSRVGHYKTVRRFEIARCCVALVHAFDGDEELTRACLETVLGDSFQETFTTGAVLGVLTPAEVAQIVTLAKSYGKGDVGLAFDENGRPIFQQPAQKAS